MSEAIRSTDPVAVSLAVELGSEVNGMLGGDLLHPLYFALVELKVRALRRVLGTEAVIHELAFRSTAKSQNMTASAGLALMSSHETQLLLQRAAGNAELLEHFEQSLSDFFPKSDGDETRILEIIQILLRNGADPNAVEMHGLSPLGYVQEIIEDVGDVGLQAQQLLREHGATVVVRWSEFQ